MVYAGGYRFRTRIKFPGEYDGSAYYRKDSKYNFYHINYHCLLDNDPEYFGWIVKHPGTFQLICLELGLLANVKCYHGFKINESNEEVNFSWNGKNRVMCLSGVKNEKQEMKILYTCVACNSTWSVSFPKIQHLIKSEEMKRRLFILCSTYWEERNPGKLYPFAMDRIKNGTQTISIRRAITKYDHNYAVSWYDEETKEEGTSFTKGIEKAFEIYQNK